MMVFLFYAAKVQIFLKKYFLAQRHEEIKDASKLITNKSQRAFGNSLYALYTKC